MRRVHLPFLAAEVILAALLLAFAVVVKHHPGPFPGDVGLELGVQKALLPHALLRDPIEAISVLDFAVPVIVTLGVIAAGFLLLRRWVAAILVPIAAGIEASGNTAIKDWVRRPRPAGHGIHVIQHITTSFSFPSGHVTYAVTIYGLVIVLSTQMRRSVPPALVWTLRIILIVLILLMPVSRVLEGVHWPSDTLGGGLEGLLWVLIFTHLYLWTRARFPRLVPADEQ
jgi:undecaprenyl-diphosphatase